MALNGSTAVTYTPPPGATQPVVATFTYRAMDAKGLKSQPATVTVNVAPNQAPTANPETVTTLAAPLTINVLTNDTDPEGNVPLTVANLTQPAAGRGSVSTDGTTVSYTPPATVTTAFTTTFTYQARDSLGALSAPPPSRSTCSHGPQPARPSRSPPPPSWPARTTVTTGMSAALRR